MGLLMLHVNLPVVDTIYLVHVLSNTVGLLRQQSRLRLHVNKNLMTALFMYNNHLETSKWMCAV